MVLLVGQSYRAIDSSLLFVKGEELAVVVGVLAVVLAGDSLFALLLLLFLLEEDELTSRELLSLLVVLLALTPFVLKVFACWSFL